MCLTGCRRSSPAGSTPARRNRRVSLHQLHPTKLLSNQTCRWRLSDKATANPAVWGFFSVENGKPTGLRRESFRNPGLKGVPRAAVGCLCRSSLTDVQTFPIRFKGFSPPERRLSPPESTPADGSVVTFDNVAVNRGPEFLPGVLVEVLPVDDPHLFEESRLAALASAEQQDLHQPFHVGFLPGQTSVDLLRLSDLFYLAAVQ